MPEILEKLVGKLEAKGKPKSNAFAIATSALQKQGKMKKGSQQLTPKGKAASGGKKGPVDPKTLGSMKKSLNFD